MSINPANVFGATMVGIFSAGFTWVGVAWLLGLLEGLEVKSLAVWGKKTLGVFSLALMIITPLTVGDLCGTFIYKKLRMEDVEIQAREKFTEDLGKAQEKAMALLRDPKCHLGTGQKIIFERLIKTSTSIADMDEITAEIAIRNP